MHNRVHNLQKEGKKNLSMGNFYRCYGELEFYYREYSLICGSKILSIRYKINFYVDLSRFYVELKIAYNQHIN
jgi:hypothetical protein